MSTIPRQGLAGLRLGLLSLSIAGPVLAQRAAVVEAPFRVEGASGAALALATRPDPTRPDPTSPHSCKPRTARAVVVGERGTRSLAPHVATFSGHVLGRAGTAFVAVSPTQVQGYVSTGGELFFLSSGAPAGGQVAVTPASALSARDAAQPFCRLVREHLPSADSGPGEALAGSGPAVRIADVFLDVDHRARALFSSDQDAIDYVTLLVAATTEI